MTLFSKVYFDPIENYITDFVVGLPPLWMENLFGITLGSARTREFICRDVMKNACPDIWELNLPTLEAHALEMDTPTQTGRQASNNDDDPLIAACMDIMANLPVTTDDHHIDGNSWSCRALHGAFALDNNHHCPHISFVPQEDEDGVIKCQESQKTNMTDYFTPEDFDKLEAFRAEHAHVVDLPYGFKTLYVGAEDMEEDVPEEDSEDMIESVDKEESESSGAYVSFTLAVIVSLVVAAFA